MNNHRFSLNRCRNIQSMCYFHPKNINTPLRVISYHRACYKTVQLVRGSWLCNLHVNTMHKRLHMHVASGIPFIRFMILNALCKHYTIWWLQCFSFLDVVIGFSQDEYIGDEGESTDVSRPNTPCTVTVEIFEGSLEIPLQIRLTPGEQNATSKKVEF